VHLCVKVVIHETTLRGHEHEHEHELTHSLLWVVLVAPSALSELKLADPQQQSTAVNPVSHTIWLVHIVRGLRLFLGEGVNSNDSGVVEDGNFASFSLAICSKTFDRIMDIYLGAMHLKIWIVFHVQFWLGFPCEVWNARSLYRSCILFRRLKQLLVRRIRRRSGRTSGSELPALWVSQPK